MSELTPTEQAYLRRRSVAVQDIFADGLDLLKSVYVRGMALVWNQEGNLGPVEVFAELGTEGGKLFTDGASLLQFILVHDPDWTHPVPTHDYTIAQDGTVTVGNPIEPT